MQLGRYQRLDSCDSGRILLIIFTKHIDIVLLDIIATEAECEGHR
jgi:hypothetical protein